MEDNNVSTCHAFFFLAFFVCFHGLNKEVYSVSRTAAADGGGPIEGKLYTHADGTHLAFSALCPPPLPSAVASPDVAGSIRGGGGSVPVY